MGRGDLHCHTTASDGLLPPRELVFLAREKGLSFLAITDHDTMKGLGEAEEAGREWGVRIVPGLEISTDSTGEEIHILGYFCRSGHGPLEEKMEEMREGRRARIVRMVEKLREAGLELAEEEVFARVKGETPGRVHVAQALLRRGYVATVEEAFSRYLSRGRPGYVPRPRLHPREAVSLVREAGGVPVLAHPGLGRRELVLAILPELLEEGLGGIEVYYPEHQPEDIALYSELCRRWDLIPTGGSDFHGPGHRGELGGVEVTEQVVEALRARSAASAP